MKRVLALFAVIFCCVGIPAQESLYEQMKSELNENSLPLVNLIVDISEVNKSEYVAGEIEIADYLRRTNPATDVVRYHCKCKYRGATSTGYTKKSFAVKLYDELGENLDANILGIREENNWILDAMAIDRIRMRNRVCFDVWNEMSRTPYDTKYDNRNGTKGVFVEVFINGNYHGLYCMSDKIDRKLLGLKKVKISDGGDVLVRGLLYKGISWDGNSDITLRSYEEADTDTDRWNRWELKYPDDYPSDDTWQPLMDLIDFCSEATQDEEFIQGYQDWFYTENLADYAAFTMALYVRDNGYKNTFLSVVDITQGHRYLLSPWDMDVSLGGNWDGSYYQDVCNIARYKYTAPYNRLSEQNINGFEELVASKWEEYRHTLFSCESFARRLDRYAEQFTSSGAWEREYAKWNGRPVPLKNDVAKELEYVKGWYKTNYDSLCVQFDRVIADGITNSESKFPPSNGVFTLDGRRVNEQAMRKGIYIVNGKKKVVR